MYSTITTVGMKREEWLKIRKTGIGGSDVGAICGLNPYSSAMTVYQDKITDEICDYDSEAMRVGRDLEEYVARRFMEATGFKVRRSNKMYRSKEYPFMLADIDRMIVGQEAGVEIKTASPYSADKWKDGAIPLSYLCQIMHYMIVLGKKEWYIAVLIMGQEFKYQKILWDEELATALINTERNFWNGHVIPRRMPTPDGSKACDDVLNQYFRSVGKKAMIPLLGFDEKLKYREELARQVKELERQQNQIDQEIKLFMGENELAVSEKYRVSWSEVNSARLDVKRMKEEQPEICADYMVNSTTRKFTVKAA